MTVAYGRNLGDVFFQVPIFLWWRNSICAWWIIVLHRVQKKSAKVSFTYFAVLNVVTGRTTTEVSVGLGPENFVTKNHAMAQGIWFSFLFLTTSTLTKWSTRQRKRTWCTGVFCQSAIENAQNDHAAVVQNILDNKDFLCFGQNISGWFDCMFSVLNYILVR